MRRFFVNFKKDAGQRAAEMSARAYNHYLRFRPIVDKIKLNLKKYGQSQKGINFPRKAQKA